MSTHDYDIANADAATVRADINSVLAAIATRNSGTSWGTTFSYQEVVDTTLGVTKRRNAANSGWINDRTVDETLVLSRSSNTILDQSDKGKCIVATSTFTQTLTAAATMGDGWFVGYRVESGATITFDPNSTETIDGASTLAVVGPASGFVWCNGSAFFTLGFLQAATQAQQEAASSTTVFVTPGRQHYHPSAAKAWVRADAAGNVEASYNTDSVTDDGTGLLTWTITTDFSAFNCAVGSLVNATNARILTLSSAGTGTVAARSHDDANTLADPQRWCLAAFGDHA